MGKSIDNQELIESLAETTYAVNQQVKNYEHINFIGESSQGLHSGICNYRSAMLILILNKLFLFNKPNKKASFRIIVLNIVFQIVIIFFRWSIK